MLPRLERDGVAYPVCTEGIANIVGLYIIVANREDTRFSIFQYGL